MQIKTMTIQFTRNLFFNFQIPTQCIIVVVPLIQARQVFVIWKFSVLESPQVPPACPEITVPGSPDPEIVPEPEAVSVPGGHVPFTLISTRVKENEPDEKLPVRETCSPFSSEQVPENVPEAVPEKLKLQEMCSPSSSKIPV
jgi:hypothetical protein